jgi:hypothetical protein
MRINEYLLLSMLTYLTSQSRQITVYGNITLGYYYIEAYVGTPPQKKSLILDTGSRQTIFPCMNCTECGHHMNDNFDTSKSSTFKFLTKNDMNFDWQCVNTNEQNICTFYSAYAEGSLYKGHLGIDNFVFKSELSMNDNKAKTHLFGCATKETGEFVNQSVDGIIGFGQYRRDRNFEPPTLIEVEISEGRMTNRVFSICLAENGGQLTLGDWNHKNHIEGSSEMIIDCSDQVWEDQYYLRVYKMKVFL